MRVVKAREIGSFSDAPDDRCPGTLATRSLFSNRGADPIANGVRCECPLPSQSRACRIFDVAVKISVVPLERGEIRSCAPTCSLALTRTGSGVALPVR
jgi:hypothetical protein